jgi:hypothetical protein
MTKKDPDKRDEGYNQLWKMRTIFDKLNDSYVKYYSPTELSAVNAIIVPFKHKRFGINIYKLCDSKGYTYNMTVYLGNDRKSTNPSIIATHATVTVLQGLKMWDTN